MMSGTYYVCIHGCTPRTEATKRGNLGPKRSTKQSDQPRDSKKERGQGRGGNAMVALPGWRQHSGRNLGPKRVQRGAKRPTQRRGNSKRIRCEFMNFRAQHTSQTLWQRTCRIWCNTDRCIDRGKAMGNKHLLPQPTMCNKHLFPQPTMENKQQSEIGDCQPIIIWSSTPKIIYDNDEWPTTRINDQKLQYMSSV